MIQEVLSNHYSDREVLADNAIAVRKLGENTYQAAKPGNYQILWIEKGVKSISLDFQTIDCLPGSIIFLIPDVIVNITFSSEPPLGWILEFSRDFFRDEYLEGFHIKNIDVYRTSMEIPIIVLSPKIGQRINSLAEMISEVQQSQIPNREQAAAALLKTLLVYCDSKCNIRLNRSSNNHHLNIVSLFKYHVSRNFYKKHQVASYAKMMHVTPKYLNKVVRTVMGVTAKSVIQEQLIIQACRDLKFSNESVKEIALKIGFSEPEHFSNFFKKNVGCSPLSYRQK